jgi:hypothetical protein
VRQRTLRPGIFGLNTHNAGLTVSISELNKIQGEIAMKRAFGYVVVVLLAVFASTQIFAQSNPLFGTWKLNSAKSKYTDIPAPKEMTRTVEADGASVKYTNTGVAADGSAISFSFTVKYDGKDYPTTGNAPFGADMIAIKRVSAHHYEATLKKGGKVVSTTKAEVSKDGKVTTLTATSSEDPSKGYVSVYDKQ